MKPIIESPLLGYIVIWKTEPPGMEDGFVVSREEWVSICPKLAVRIIHEWRAA